ncbi:partial GDP-mannose-dependent alpha-(1-6)-phosphatidylinositol monomannoside mannosyltransferase, partial [Anaerolineae bacterium]
NMDYRAQGFPYKAAFTHRWCDTEFLRHPADLLFVRPASGLPLLQGYASNVVHLPYVIDANVFTPAGGRGHDGEELTVGYLGRLVPEKGLDLLVRACASLPANVKLRIAGRGPMRDMLGSLAAEAGIGDRVRITDAVPYADVPAFLRGLDILALPSRPSTIWMEQFGRVLIEAMACGVPVVAAASGEIPAVLADGGVLVPPGDIEALGGALRSLAASADSRTQIGNAGRARALAVFDARAVATRFLETLSLIDIPHTEA